MAEYISSWGKSTSEIRRTAGDQIGPSDVSARISIPGSQRLVDENGHVVKLELPGEMCGLLRAAPGCLYSEVLHTANLADATIIVAFESLAAFEMMVTELSATVFKLGHLTLHCPPLSIVKGSLDEVLASEMTDG